MLRKLQKCPNCKAKNHREVIFCYACGIEIDKFKQKESDPYTMRMNINYWSIVKFLIQFFLMGLLVGSILFIIVWWLKW